MSAFVCSFFTFNAVVDSATSEVWESYGPSFGTTANRRFNGSNGDTAIQTIGGVTDVSGVGSCAFQDRDSLAEGDASNGNTGLRFTFFRTGATTGTCKMVIRRL